MRLTWQRSALDDVRAIVPEQFRKPLRYFLRNLTFVGQGMRCTDSRYEDAYFIKFHYWYIMYRPVAEGHIDIIGVEYNYGQLP